MSIIVRHSSTFKPYKLSLPINWRVDPYKNKNWLHHFNSLRWLSDEQDLTKIENILRDFYKFHCVKKNKNPYYDDLRGDHTAAIRIGVFLEFKERFSNFQSISGVGICNRLIRDEIKNLQNEKLYRSGHNHALMVDIALLQTILDAPEYKIEVNLDLILRRSSETLDAMWFPTGLTKEHSVSYQEYNLPLTIKYFYLLDKLGLVTFAKTNKEAVLEESKKFLGFSLRSNGEYFPVGDSFRTPNMKILNQVFGDEQKIIEPKELLAPYSQSQGFYYNSNFLVYRGIVSKKSFHFMFTCCWNSENHKKNDELSFCIEIDGDLIFDFSGWSAFSTRSINEYLSTEYANTTVISLGSSYSDKQVTDVLYGKSEVSIVNLEEKKFKGTHHRIPGVVTSREFELKNDGVLITDSFDLSRSEAKFILKKFVLGKGVNVEVENSHKVVLYKDETPVATMTANSVEGFFTKSMSKVVSSNKLFLDDVNVIDYIQYGYSEVKFKIEVF